MELVLQYLIESWAELMLVFGLLVLLRTDVYYDKKMISALRLTLLYLLLYSVAHYTEICFGMQPELSPWRFVLTVMNYSLPMIIMVRVIGLFFRLNQTVLYLPVAVNIALCIISCFNGVVFTFTPDNHFQRGPLGYMPFIFYGLYLVYFVFLLYRAGLTANREDRLVTAYLTLTTILLIVMPLVLLEDFERCISTTITVNIAIYYIFILHQMTKRDPMTKLLNRQSYYKDMENLREKITAMILLDMNGLKAVNDKQGHLAGDHAIITIADTMFRNIGGGQRIYRIGGDEFVVFCMRMPEEKVTAMIAKIRAALEKTEYSCSIGYVMVKPWDDMENAYILADNRMYQDKQKYYETHERQR